MCSNTINYNLQTILPNLYHCNFPEYCFEYTSFFLIFYLFIYYKYIIIICFQEGVGSKGFLHFGFVVGFEKWVRKIVGCTLCGEAELEGGGGRCFFRML